MEHVQSVSVPARAAGQKVRSLDTLTKVVDAALRVGVAAPALRGPVSALSSCVQVYFVADIIFTELPQPPPIMAFRGFVLLRRSLPLRVVASKRVRPSMHWIACHSSSNF